MKQYFMFANKLRAFWSHTCLLRHQIDMFRNFSNLFYKLYYITGENIPFVAIESTIYLYQRVPHPYYLKLK